MKTKSKSTANGATATITAEKQQSGDSLQALEEICAVIGIDLGDKQSKYCVLDMRGNAIGDGGVATTPAALRLLFSGKGRMRIAMEVGTHSPWVSRLLTELGHEVIVANPRKLRLITESDVKNDHADASLLARLAYAGPDLLSPVEHRSDKVQHDLAVIRAREVTVTARARMVTAVRGIVKSTGARLKVCSTGAFASKALADCPEPLRLALLPLLRLIQQLTTEIRLYDRVVARKGNDAYPEIAPILTIPGVGPLTALTFVLLLNNDKRKFSRSRNLGCYFGLCPKQRDSGQHVSQLGITKAGDTLMRKLAVQCAHFMLGRFGKDSALRRWGLSLALRGGKNAKKRAVIAVARKLVILMHRLWITQEAFDATRGQQTEPQAA
jgi:transposase